MRGMLLRMPDVAAERKARGMGLAVETTAEWRIPWAQTVIVSPAVRIPWDLLDAGLYFVERWDAAAPLWRYGVLAADVGTQAERERTEAVCLDLRAPLFAPELLFVRDSEAGRALLRTWREECTPGWDERLAFLRALHVAKPMFCALPRSWLIDVQQRSQIDARSVRPATRAAGGLVRVEIAPGRFVRCHTGEEEKVKRMWAERLGPRGERRKQGARI